MYYIIHLYNNKCMSLQTTKDSKLFLLKLMQVFLLFFFFFLPMKHNLVCTISVLTLNAAYFSSMPLEEHLKLLFML